MTSGLFDFDHIQDFCGFIQVSRESPAFADNSPINLKLFSFSLTVDYTPRFIFAKVNFIYMNMAIVKSLIIFLLAGICEIGGGYLVWLWIKEDKPYWYGILGAIILAFYGVVATWQTSNFGRVYATYGGIFIVLSLLWAWKIDGFRPDRYDIIGALVALIGVCIIFYAPRSIQT